MRLPQATAVRDVTLRDGLQDENPIPTSTKLAVLESLFAAGVQDLELASFVRPDRVPAMADADALARAAVPLAAVAKAHLWGLVLNRRGAERAVSAGLNHLQFVVSVSPPHNEANAGRSVEGSLGELAGVLDVAAGATATVEVTLATAWGCPHAGPVTTDAVVRLAKRVGDLGIRYISLADTIGTAVPTEVANLVGAVRTQAAVEAVGVHLHDTRGLALANSLVALEAGANRLDAALGGLGGCPFAPGASGNLPLEDLVHALDGMDVATGLDLDALLTASSAVCGAVDRAPASHVGIAGPRFAQLHPSAA